MYCQFEDSRTSLVDNLCRQSSRQRSSGIYLCEHLQWEARDFLRVFSLPFPSLLRPFLLEGAPRARPRRSVPKTKTAGKGGGT